MRGKTISNSWRNPTADYRKDPIANIYIQESIEWFSVSDGSQMNFLEQFKNLKHFMGLFDPNIEKGSRINEQNTLRKKKKQNKKSTVRVQFLLKPFLFLHTALHDAWLELVMTTTTREVIAVLDIHTYDIYKLCYVDAHETIVVYIHSVLVHQSQMRPGPETLEACLNGVDKTFSLSGNGLTWICIPSCKQLCLSRRQNTQKSQLSQSFVVLILACSQYCRLQFGLNRFKTRFSWCNVIIFQNSVMFENYC